MRISGIGLLMRMNIVQSFNAKQLRTRSYLNESKIADQLVSRSGAPIEIAGNDPVEVAHIRKRVAAQQRASRIKQLAALSVSITLIVASVWLITHMDASTFWQWIFPR